jgi:pyruvate dehydrogenase E2 component (dihydrolipoamide acetyltransferase)
MWKIGMPNLGHTMEFGKVVSWLKRQGDTVEPGEAIAIVETDKVTVDVEAPAAGRLLAIFAEPGKSIAVGATIAVVGDASEAEAAAKLADEAPVEKSAEPKPGLALRSISARAHVGRHPISPAARRRAEELELDVSRIAGTGEGGLVTRADVERFAVDAPATLVLLHGFGAGPSLFAPILGERDLGRSIVTLALPGHDDGPELPETPDIAGLARALRVTPVFQGAARIVLCGHSLGGAVAVALAQAMPERIAGLVLVAPLGLGTPINANFLAEFLAGADPARADAALTMLVARPDRIARAFRDETVRRMGDVAYATRLRRIADACFAPALTLGSALASLTCPVSIVWGREDRVLALPATELIPRRADFHVVAQAGHLLPVERPATLALHLGTFLQEHLEKKS